ncbi:MAG TPA: FtsX-like permease family protein [Trueperaceae bacterium]|nr:FtsX-like permease family protein [Trueperaceae bacterium]
MVVVAYASLAIVFLWGFMDGFLSGMLTSQGRLVAAPVMITTPAYHTDPDPSHALPVLPPLEQLARTEPQVRQVAPRLEFGALLRSPYTSQGVMARGVDPAREGSVSAIPGAVAEGRMLRGPGEIVLGKGVAERLDSRVGERVAIDASAADGPQSLGLRLVGIVDSGTPAVDDTTALVDIADARRLTGVATATGLALDVPSGQEARVASRLNAALPGAVTAYPVDALIGQLAKAMGWGHVEVLVLGLVFSLFAAVAVTSTVVVSVMERSREFGVMVALGLDQGRLSTLVTLESIYATALGWLLGAAAGYGLLWLFSVWNVFGPLFTGLYGQLLSGITLPDQLLTAVRPEYLLYATTTIALAALFAVLAPARRVRSLRPAEAMRSE